MGLEALNKGKNPAPEVQQTVIGGKPTLIVTPSAMIRDTQRQREQAERFENHIGIHAPEIPYWPEPTHPEDDKNGEGRFGERTISMT